MIACTKGSMVALSPSEESSMWATAISSYYETCGNQRGKPAIVLHGGPGSGCMPWHRRLLDPTAYRIVLFRSAGMLAEHAACERI
jgi:hypothetical protein